ncbi:MAG: toxin-antitoxin system YwqK family antitoxin, partial [Plesiomonas sp.]
ITTLLAQGTLVHGPLTLLDNQYDKADQTQRDLRFYHFDGAVYPVTFPYGEKHPSEAKIWDRLSHLASPSPIKAVFYTDLDTGGEYEVIVMYEDATGQRLRAYGKNEATLAEGDWVTPPPPSANVQVPLERLQPLLDSLAPTLKPFTVAQARRALDAIPPLLYQARYDDSALTDSAALALLQGQLLPKAQVQAIFDEHGFALFHPQPDDPAKSHPVLSQLSQSERNKIQTIVLTVPEHRRPAAPATANNPAPTSPYVLTALLRRQDVSCGSNFQSFILTEMRYQRADSLRQNPDEIEEALLDGEQVRFIAKQCELRPERVVHFQQGVRHGQWQTWDCDYRLLLEQGEYVQGQRQGEWKLGSRQHFQPIYTANNLWQGRYLNDQPQGLWKQTLIYHESIRGRDTPFAGGEKHYQNGVLHGAYQSYRLVMGKKANGENQVQLRLSEQGQQVNGKHEGVWRSGHADGGYTDTHYHNSQVHGEQREYDAEQRLIRITQLEGIERQGEEQLFYPSGQPKEISHYQNNARTGSQLTYHPNGQLAQVRHWQPLPIPENPKFCRGFSCLKDNDKPNSLLEGEQRDYDEQGQLVSIEYYQAGQRNGPRYTFSGQRLKSSSIYRNDRNNGVTSRYLTDKQPTLPPSDLLISYHDAQDEVPIGPLWQFAADGSLSALEQGCRQRSAAAEPDSTFGLPATWRNANARCGSQYRFHPDGQLSRMRYVSAGDVLHEVLYHPQGRWLSLLLPQANGENFLQLRHRPDGSVQQSTSPISPAS